MRARVPILLVTFLLMATASAFADCTLSQYRWIFLPDTGTAPAIPVATENDDVRLHIEGTCTNSCTPHAPKVIVDDTPTGRFIVVFHDTIKFNDQCRNAAGPVGFKEDIDFPPLHAALWTVQVDAGIGPPLIYETNLAIGKPFLDVRPKYGHAGSEVLITGEKIGATGTAEVFFGGIPAKSVRIIDENRIIAVVPVTGGPAKLEVKVVQPVVRPTVERNAFRNDLVPEASYFARVLFPIAFSGAGALGSEWRTDNFIRNNGLIALATDAGTIPSNGSARLAISTSARGVIVQVPRDLVEGATYASHVRDVSRSNRDSGTEIRVVTDDRTSDSLNIIGVSLENTNRYALRIYDIDSIGREVLVRATKADGTVAGEATAGLTTNAGCVAPCSEPAFAMIDLRSVTGSTTDTVDITISSPGARLWALLSATNNDTQHVTTYTPQR